MLDDLLCRCRAGDEYGWCAVEFNSLIDDGPQIGACLFSASSRNEVTAAAAAAAVSPAAQSTRRISRQSVSPPVHLSLLGASSCFVVAVRRRDAPSWAGPIGHMPILSVSQNAITVGAWQTDQLSAVFTHCPSYANARFLSFP